MLILTVLLLSQMPTDYVPGHCGTAIFQSRHEAQAVPIPVRDRPTPPKLGEDRIFWLMNMSVMPPAQYEAEMTCRGIGGHCYVFVEDSSWNAGQMDSTDVAFILDRFNRTSPADSTRGVWQHNTGTLGYPPDADQDSLIYILYYDVGSFHGYTFDGFWMYFDEYPDSIAYPRWGYHSNEIECVYLDDFPNDPGTDYRVGIVAHEFAHMIHYNYDQVESLWVNEGCAELAMWLYGAPDPISEFSSNPGNDLLLWNGTWSDYIQTYLFFLYLYEQYGERTGTPLINRIVANPYVSIEGLDSTFAELGLSRRFQGAFNDWVVANFLDDTLNYGGRFGYFGESLPAFGVINNHNTYPVNQSSSVQRWAARYARFGRGTGDLALNFDGADGAQFKATVIARDTIARTFTVDSIRLDTVQAGSITIPGFGSTVHQVILAAANNAEDAGTTGFRYTAAIASGVEEQPAGIPASGGLAASARNRKLTLDYRARVNGTMNLRLFDVSGATVFQSRPQVRAGHNLLELDLGGIAAGTYFVEAELAGRTTRGRVTVVR